MRRLSIIILMLFLAFCTFAASGEPNLLHGPGGRDLLISVNPSLHQQYGLSYPITFIAQFSTDAVGLQAFVRYDTVSAWTAMPEKVETELFNGIDAVRFDYTTHTAYVSATFADASDDIYIRITETVGEPLALTFGGIAPYYDNRRGVVVIGVDDWKDYTDALFIRMASILRSYHLPYTAAVITGETTDSTWAHIQTELDAGSFEAATHSRTHPRWPAGDVESEVGGSYTDLRDNLTLPAQYRKGNTEYVYSYIVPYGESSPEIEEEITRSGYLLGRLVGSQNGLYTAWDTSAGRFRSDGTTKEMGPPWGSTDATELNGAFDSRMAQKRIYHLLMHPYSLDATDEWTKPYFSEHLAHISNRTDVWYTTYGHLYVYRLLGDSTVGQTVWPEAPPTITTQPVSRILVVGATATFSCGAKGTPPLTYQWQRNAMDIPGADRSSYSHGNVTMADSGSTFRCIVRNSHGTAMSDAATLSVVPDQSSSGITSDDFNTEALNTSLWHFVDPLHDVTLGLTGGGTEDARLALTIPAGTTHDIWTEGNTAPRIMQACANSDLEIEAKFDAPMSASNQIQGLLVEQDGLNYIRFDIVSDPPRLGFFAATFTNGEPTEQVDMAVELEAPYYVRVQRVGDLWTGLYSSDGETWTQATSFTHEITVQEVGAWAGNSGSPAPAFTGLIDYFFNSQAPVLDEDGPDIRVRPVITTDPVSVTVLEGQPASFTVTVSSTTPITYRWQKNGIDIAGETGTTFALTAAARSDSGAVYRCIVSNIVGRDTSAAARLIVLPLVPAVVTREPIDTTVFAGQSAGFSIAATGTAPLTYRWQKNGTDIPDANDSSYAIANAVQADSGSTFRCIVTNIGGSDTSTTALLRVSPVFAAQVTREPIDTTVFAGQSAGFSIAATGTAPLTYRWQKNGTDIPDANDSSYAIANAVQADSGSTFRCIVTNIGGSDTSTTAVLRVSPVFAAQVTREPIDTTVFAGQSAGFSIAATGTAPLTYRWQKNGTDIPDANDSSYAIANAVQADSGSTFRCIVTNIGGSDTSTTALLRVSPVFAAQVTREPIDTTVFAGQSAGFSIAATGTAPLTYRWQKNGTDIPDANDSSYAIANAVQADSGSTFRCIVTNIGGSDTSITALLRVSPVFAAQVTREPIDTTVFAGQSAGFSIAATGTAPLTYRWQKNGTDIPDANDSSYAIANAVQADSGSTFRCIVTNIGGSDTSTTALLRVSPVFAAQVTREPIDTTVFAGQSAGFSIAATGTAPLTYRWQKNGTDVPDAIDSSYAIANAVQADSGSTFRCIVTNIGGSDTSTTALLRVSPVFAAQVTREPIDTTVFAGQSAGFSIAATGTAPLTYRWQKNGTDVPDAIDSSYAIANAVQADSGSTFRCIVTNIGGSDTSAAVHLLVVAEPAPTGVRLNLVVLLQGAMEGDSMRTILLASGLLPRDHPFTGTGWGMVPGDSVVMMPDGTVDWVLIELRRGTADSTVQVRKAGLLRNTGAVTETDGINPLHFATVPPGNYFIVVRHRNHLPVMSAMPVGLESTPVNFDFTTAATQCYSSDVALLAGGRYAMVAGNADGNGGIGATDLALIRLKVGSAPVYGSADVDLNGAVGTEDLILTRTNIGRITAVP